MSDPDTPSLADYDIAIVGGGTVGSLFARLVAASDIGWRIALIDTHAFTPGASAHYQPDYDNRSTALSAGTVDLMRRLGLWDKLGRHATAIRQVLVSDRGHLGGACLDAAERGRDALGQVVENAWLAPCLREAAAAAPGVETLAPARVERISPQPHGMKLNLQGGAVDGDQAPAALTARLVVLADGGLSNLHRQLGIERTRRDYAQRALIANVSFERPHQGRAFERFTPDGPLALLPLDESPEGRRAALVWTLPPERAERMMAAAESDFLDDLQTAFGWRLGRLTRVGERQSWPLSLIEAREQIRSRLVLLGNSAHYLHPVAGQGFNLSARDAAALAACLNKAHHEAMDPGDLRLLSRYADQRRTDQALTVQLSDQLVRVFTSRRPLWMALRHLGFLALDWVPGAKAVFSTQTMGLAAGRPDVDLLTGEVRV